MPSGGFGFGPFRLEVGARLLRRHGEPVALTARQFDLLLELVDHAGETVPKSRLMDVGWPDVQVTENNLVKAITQLRQILDAADPDSCIRTVSRLGYRFVAPVTRDAVLQTDVDLDEILAPHRAMIEGRAALETLEADGVRAARATFEERITQHPRHAPLHVGLANACVLLFESTRTDEQPDRLALATAAEHAQEACRLSPDLAQAWATLGVVFQRTGNRVESLAALQRAVMLEPDNWLIHLRHAEGSWGDERYRAARRTLDLYPHFPLAHWFAASVYVARNLLDRAEREIDAALFALETRSNGTSRFSPVAIHWLAGRLLLARGAEDQAMAAFRGELALEDRGHLYARECCAHTWCDIAAIHLRRGERDDACAAAREAITRVPRHPGAAVILASLDGTPDTGAVQTSDAPGTPDVAFECHIAAAVKLVLDGNAPAAADYLANALVAAPPGVAGWQIPLEPLLSVSEHPDVWRPVLQMLADRAA